MSEYTSKISLPIEFFIKERDQAYSNWKTAFWRELLANELDAGGTVIHITLEDGKVVFSGNGPGMTRHIAETVYLTVGKSSKDALGEGVGGFGRARVLTCFSMEEYILTSQDYQIKGSGPDYRIDSTEEYFRGLKLEIKSKDFKKSWMQTALTTVLSTSNLPDLKVFLNGQPFYWVNLVPNPEKLQTLPIGTVFSAADRIYMLYVRVNGLVMFDRHMPSAKGGAAVIDLLPELSRGLLTANRDGPKPALAQQISEIDKKLSVEGNDAFAVTNLSFTRTYQCRKGPRKLRNILAGKHALASQAHAASAFNRLADNAPKKVVHKSSGRMTTAEITKKEQALISRFADRDVEEQTLPVDAFNIGYHVNTKSELLKSVLPNWDPQFWYGSSCYQSKLFAVWEFFCDSLVFNLQEARPHISSVVWTPGFCFRKDRALCVREHSWATNEFEAHLLFNPFQTVHGEETIQLCHPTLNLTDLKVILSTALHEVCHIAEPGHDIDYASVQTDMLSILDQAYLLDRAEKLVKRY